jgi:hypothetical protein
LYNLLRIEHVKTAPIPLSSDAFSNFQVADADKKVDEVRHLNGYCIIYTKNLQANIREAVNRLREEIIPDLANKLLSREVKVNNGEELCVELHRRGVPIRCLGLLRMAVKQVSFPKGKMTPLHGLDLASVLIFNVGRGARQLGARGDGLANG